ncbi:MAG TPA: type II toxin-antitoxin system VapC family toxin [Polyangia bacterium]
MSYLLDTNMCSYVLKRRFGLAARLERMSPADLHVSAITLAEARVGALKSEHRARLLAAWDHFLRPFCERILPFDKDAAEHYGDIRAHLERRGEMIGDRDCMIASIARSNGLVLVTANLGELRRVPELPVEDWREGP